MTTAPLFTAAASTFEDLACLLPTDQLDEVQASADPEAEAHVAFTGPFAGTLVVRMHGRLLPLVAANMLGTDEPSQSLQLDALGEIANVLCGNLLPLVAGGCPVFDLEAPRVCILTGEESPPATLPSASLCLGIEHGWVEVALYLKGGLPA
jgi:CheY-specific phosphatase CheX